MSTIQLNILNNNSAPCISYVRSAYSFRLFFCSWNKWTLWEELESLFLHRIQEVTVSVKAPAELVTKGVDAIKITERLVDRSRNLWGHEVTRWLNRRCRECIRGCIRVFCPGNVTVLVREAIRRHARDFCIGNTIVLVWEVIGMSGTSLEMPLSWSVWRHVSRKKQHLSLGLLQGWLELQWFEMFQIQNLMTIHLEFLHIYHTKIFLLTSMSDLTSN